MADGLISSAQLEAVLYANMRFGVFLEGPGLPDIDFITPLLTPLPAEASAVAVNLHTEEKLFRCHCTLCIKLWCPTQCPHSEFFKMLSMVVPVWACQHACSREPTTAWQEPCTPCI